MWPHWEEGKTRSDPSPIVHLQDAEGTVSVGGISNSLSQGVVPTITESSLRQSNGLKSLSRRKDSPQDGPSFRLVFLVA